jgi:hypothetical protein
MLNAPITPRSALLSLLPMRPLIVLTMIVLNMAVVMEGDVIVDASTMTWMEAAGSTMTITTVMGSSSMMVGDATMTGKTMVAATMTVMVVDTIVIIMVAVIAVIMGVLHPKVVVVGLPPPTSM